MSRGYVAIVSIDLHLPTSDSLKAKRGDVRSLKADLQHRFGAAVAEVDHHDLRQRALITAALVDRRSSDLGGRVADVERFVLARHETARLDVIGPVKPEDFE